MKKAKKTRKKKQNNRKIHAGREGRKLKMVVDHVFKPAFMFQPAFKQTFCRFIWGR